MSQRRLLILAHDALATLVALFGAFFLRWGSTQFAAQIEAIAATCLAVLPVALAAYWFVRLPNLPWKFVSLNDLNRILAAAAVPAFALVAIGFLARGEVIVPRTVPVIYWLLQIGLLAGPRIFYRTYRNRRRDRRAFRGLYRNPVIIAGTDDEAEGLIRRLRRDAVSALEPVALLTPRGRDLGERIHGVPILGELADLEAVLRKLDIRQVRPRRLIVTRQTLAAPGIDALLGSAGRLGLAAVRVSQALTDIDRSDGPVALAPVSIDDLLGRPSREMDLSAVRALVGGRNVLVTGAGGSIGAELCRQIAAMGPRRLMAFERSEWALWSVSREVASAHPALDLVRWLGDVTDRADLGAAFASFAPDLVFHAAALKHVDLVEAHPVAAASVNTLGTEEVARAAAAAGVRCAVFISTDKAVDPVSVLGATKRAGELVFAAHDRAAREEGRPTRFLTVRFGNVLGSSGSVIPLFTEQLRRGGPITVTHPEVERYFMTVSEAVRLVLLASAEGAGSTGPAQTYVLDMGEPIRIDDLARRMIRLAGLEPDVDVAIAFTGLRPGERLSEVLETGDESLAPTAVPGVRATEPRPLDPALLGRQLAALAAAVDAYAEPDVRRTLVALVPEYRPEQPVRSAESPKLRVVGGAGG